MPGPPVSPAGVIEVGDRWKHGRRQRRSATRRTLDQVLAVPRPVVAGKASGHSALPLAGDRMARRGINRGITSQRDRGR